MPVNFKIPASPAIQIYENDTFLGADFTTDAGNIDDTKSPDVVNMIRSVPGKVRKRMGYKQVSDLDGQPIYGVHFYSYANVWVIHAGDKLYQFRGGTESFWVNEDDDKIVTNDNYNIFFSNSDLETTSDMVLLYEGMAENRSTAYELNQMLVILDGKKMLYVHWANTDDYLTCGAMEDYPDVTIPIVRISCRPDGGGVDYQAFNLISPRFEQDFIIDSSHSTATSLQLYTDKLANDEVKMRILNANGEWEDRTEGTHFTVNRNTGTIYFTSTTTTDPIVHADGDAEGYSVSVSIRSDRVSVSYKLYSNRNYSNPTYRPGYSGSATVRITVRTAANHEYTKRVDRYSGDGSTVDFSDQCITRTTYSPGVTPVTGQDNIKVWASYIPTSGSVELINHCKFGVLFGVNGASDRLFVSGNDGYGDNLDENGNPDGTTYSLKNRDWYSDRYDPTYFPDIGYSELGSDTSAIMGYAVVNSYLATFKDNFEPSQTVFIREGDLVSSDLDGDQNEETNPSFKLINTLQGSGAISNYCFDYLEVEPIFLSKMGIYSLTSQDITGEKYAQNRSYYLNKKLMNERNLNQAIGFTWKDYYVLCVNNHFYILDGLQPMRTDKSAPYALRQYASFYFEFELEGDEVISYAWQMYGFFYFGTTHGRVMRFYRDDKDINSYNDNGKAIPAHWQTPDISGKLFYKNKTFRYVAVKVTPARNSSILIEGTKNGVWDEIKKEYAKTKYFSFIGLTFARTPENDPQFTFICDRSQKVVTTKTRIKKVDKVQFRFSNNEINQPLGINNFALEYTQGGNIK